MRERINRCVSWVRNLSRELRPAVLEHLGLAEAIRVYAENRAADYAGRIEVSLEHPSDTAAAQEDPEVRVAVNRIAQEAISNSIRHSGAERIQVRVRDGKRFALEVKDDGHGFDLERQTGSGQGVGLLSMRERAELPEAEFSIRSRPGQGTQILVEAQL